LALRQAFGAAVRWRYMTRNPAIEAGRNPEPVSEELLPFAPDEIDALEAELGPAFGPLVTFAAETGLRTNEWVALERRDVDRSGPAVVVQRRYADRVLTPNPKTGPRRVPLSARAVAALDRLPPRLDTPLLFPAARGGHIGLDGWRTRHWYPALEAAGLKQRGPYAPPHLRHRGAGRRHLNLRAGAGDGHQREDGGPDVRPFRARLRAGDSRAPRRQGRP
jgi:integrase